MQLGRGTKRGLVLVCDVVLCLFTVWLYFALSLETWAPPAKLWLLPALVSVLLAIPILWLAGLYRTILRFAGQISDGRVYLAAAGYGALYTTLFSVLDVADVPTSLGWVQPIMLMVAIEISRQLACHVLLGMHARPPQAAPVHRVLIYGAGSAGRQLAVGLRQSKAMKVLGYLDDDVRLHHHRLDGLEIYDPSDLRSLQRRLQCDEVLLAIPSTSRSRRNEIIEHIQSLHILVKTLPGLTDLAQGKVQVSDLRDLEIEDLLGRDPVPPQSALLTKNIAAKVVLVTGAGGSIGSELCRQILRVGPAVLLLLEMNEYALYGIHQELEKAVAGQQAAPRLVPLLGSVQDMARLIQIMRTWQPHTVYHAAAYKHVPMVEHNPCEGIRNNVMGTLCAARAAMESGVQDFVLISTDKAVRPTNVMGASKRLAEMVLQALAESSKGATRLSMVRFGNVLGSSGSVVPLFRNQISQGGPITLTHVDITRYFMTIPEAAQLVIQAGAMAAGGDVFVLDMGEPIKIYDLAVKMVDLSGLRLKTEAQPEGDIEIAVTGLRPGEKLYEELLIGDNPLRTPHPRILKAHEHFLSWPELHQRLEQLSLHLQNNEVESVRGLLQELVGGYQPEGELVDWVYMEQASQFGGLGEAEDPISPDALYGAARAGECQARQAEAAVPAGALTQARLN